MVVLVVACECWLRLLLLIVDGVVDDDDDDEEEEEGEEYNYDYNYDDGDDGLNSNVCPEIQVNRPPMLMLPDALNWSYAHRMYEVRIIYLYTWICFWSCFIFYHGQS